MSANSARPRRSDEYLLVAIDGTHSRTAYNVNYTDPKSGKQLPNASHTKRLYTLMRVGDDDKLFTEGPDNGLTGSDLAAKVGDAHDFLKRRLSVKPDARIVLIGHSRGGHGVIDLAYRLQKDPVGHHAWQAQATDEPQPVHFLGLFDAVDRTPGSTDTDVIPSNVLHMYHAARSPSLDSRSSFGNTGTRVEKSNPNKGNYYLNNSFQATHGAVGGSPPHECTWTPKLVVFGDSCSRYVSLEENTREGERAFEYVAAAARALGVPV